jgi:hypothetical protein
MCNAESANASYAESSLFGQSMKKLSARGVSKNGDP